MIWDKSVKKISAHVSRARAAPERIEEEAEDAERGEGAD